MTRRRLYIIMVHMDVRGSESLEECARTIVDALSENQVTVPWSDPHDILLRAVSMPYLFRSDFLLDDNSEDVRMQNTKLEVPKLQVCCSFRIGFELCAHQMNVYLGEARFQKQQDKNKKQKQQAFRIRRH